MAINGFSDAIGKVIEQTNYLERKLRQGMRPKLVLRAAAAQRSLEYFDARIGETKTFTRSNPIAPNITPMNPSSNTGLDNGLTPRSRGFEQWQAVLNEWADGVDLNLEGNETLAGDLFTDNWVELGASAANSLEVISVQRAVTAYDSGDTFITAYTSGSTVSVDNINGFDTQYQTTVSPSYGLPAAVSSSNKLLVMVISPTGTVRGTANVTLATADGSNASYMQTGGVAFGRSGTLTLDSVPGSTAAHDRIVALDPNAPTTAFNATYKDGSFVVRPLDTDGNMYGTAYALSATDVIAPSIQIPQAVALLSRRQVPRLKNGLYGCAIDATLLSYFYQDEGFQRATMGTWDRGSVYPNGIVAKGWGVEFVEASQLPVYQSPNGSFPLRHAFCFGEDVISEHPFAGARNAISRAGKAGDIMDVRWVDLIRFISQAPLDRLAENYKLTYKYTGDFQPGTDKGSNPSTIFTSDYCRYKRGVLVQAASSI